MTTARSRSLKGVEIETEWNLKIFLLDGRLKLDSVEIETEWNLKAYQINLGRWPRKVEIETEWNLKCIDEDGNDTEIGRNRNRVEFKEL